MSWDAKAAKAMQERLARELETTKGQVMEVMRMYPQSRNDDGVLICQWLVTFKKVESFDGLLRLAAAHQFTFETVRRSRQQLQAAGLYLPTDEAIIKRRRLETVYRQVMAQGGELQ